MAAHLKLVHSGETEVAAIINRQLSNGDERRALAEITMKGNYYHIINGSYLMAMKGRNHNEM